MMRFVYKYPILLEDAFGIEMPVGAELLHLDVQGGEPFLWALVDIRAPKETRTFAVVGTGHPVADGLTHVGSFLLMGGSFVGHLFEIR